MSSLIENDKEALTKYQKEIVSKINSTCGFIRFELGRSKPAPKFTKNGQPKQRAGRKKTSLEAVLSSSSEGSIESDPDVAEVGLNLS